jgi:hypothetical protein
MRSFLTLYRMSRVLLMAWSDGTDRPSARTNARAGYRDAYLRLAKRALRELAGSDLLKTENRCTPHETASIDF